MRIQLKEQIQNFTDLGDETLWEEALMESKTINEAIKSCNYNMTKVAKALGISRNTLYLKIKKYKIEE